MKITKILSAVIAGCLLLSSAGIPASASAKTIKTADQVLKEELGKNKGSVRVIIETKSPLTDVEQKKILGNRGQHKKSLKSINGFNATVSAGDINSLKNNKSVKTIHIDQKVKASGYAYYDDTARIPSAPQVWNEAKTQGEGVGVAVIDSGVYPHKDLVQPINRIVAFKDFVNGKTYPYDDNGHGTHVAGIVAGNGSNSGYKYIGVAPKTNIVALKALDSQGSGYMSDIIAAIDWSIQYKSSYNIKVINLSLGGAYQYANDPLMQSVEKAHRSGILVVAAGGNNGPTSVVDSPAASPYALAVGGSDSVGTVKPYDDRFSSFSVRPQIINGVNKPEIFAPSMAVVSLNSPGSTSAQQYPYDVLSGDYYIMSGTSMATPAVSGTSALLFAKYPTLTPDQMKSKLINSAIPVNGMKVLNAATSFGLTPNWSIINPPSTITEPTYTKPSKGKKTTTSSKR